MSVLEVELKEEEGDKMKSSANFWATVKDHVLALKWSEKQDDNPTSANVLCPQWYRDLDKKGTVVTVCYPWTKTV